MWKIKVFLFTCLILGSHFVHSQIIKVDAKQILRSFSSNPVGINLDYLMDDDQFLKPAIPLHKTLQGMKMGALRYPGGEKSDNYLWSVMPFAKANPHFALPGNCNWLNNEKRFTDDKIKLKDIVLDFDEYMEVVKKSGSAPFIVVAEDSYYEKGCAARPTHEKLIANAVEWVRYANINKRYGIKNWMVGNESWNYSNNGQPYLSAAQYAVDFIAFSKAMKAVDPSIKVIANSKEGEWADSLLILAKDYVDGIAISNYPVWKWEKGYDTYRLGSPDFVNNIKTVVASVKKYAPEKNIPVFVSEFNAIDWSGNWESGNDLGHALVIFQMAGDHISIKEVEGAYYWNTRWLANSEKPQDITDAVDAGGKLNATGMALSLWGNYLLDNMVISGNNGFIRSFATTSANLKKMNVFLINKDTTFQHVSVNISNFELNNADIKHIEMTGKGEKDKFPVVNYPVSTVSQQGQEIKITLAPMSANVLTLVNSI